MTQLSINLFRIEPSEYGGESELNLPFISIELPFELPFFMLDLISIGFGKEYFRFAILDFGEWSVVTLFRSIYWNFWFSLFGKSIIENENKNPDVSKVWG